MAIQHRRGAFRSFDPTKMLPGEWAVVLSGDESAADGKTVYICFAAGDVKRMATYEDMAANIRDANEEVIEELVREVSGRSAATLFDLLRDKTIEDVFGGDEG